jgi:transaldolase
VNVTLLFSAAQYVAAADAYLRGIERRIAAGLDPDVASVASVFVSRWDVAVVARVPDNLRNTLGIAVARRCYRAYIESLASRRVERVLNEGGRPQRLLFASTGTKDPAASDVLYVEALAAPLTVDTIPESTLKAFAEHGRVTTPIPRDGGGCDATIAAHGAVGIDVAALASRLQRDGAAAFVKSWNGLLAAIGAKRTGSEKVST